MAKVKNTAHSKPQVRKNIEKKEANALDKFFSDNKTVNYVFLGLIVFAILLFFKDGIFGGKIFASPDNMAPNSYKTFLSDAKSQGIFPLWIPYIFMGMPSLGSLTTALPAMHNIFSFVWDSILSAFSGDNLFLLTVPYYILFAVSLYLYIQYKFKNNLIALICSLAGVFATGIIQLIIVGHHTKMMTFAFFPLIMFIIDRLIDSRDKNIFKMLLNFALLTILIYIQLHFHHIQMLYYSYMMIGIYIGYILVYRLIKKIEVMNIVKAVSIFIIATLFAVAMDADILLSIKEYNKYSIRGSAGIEAKMDPGKTDDKPLDYNYATNWSFSPGEVLTFFMPYYYGFGTVETNGKRDNFYWGQMPFTDSPVYFGAIIFVLAIIGISFNFRRNPFVQALTLIIVLFLFASFGRTWPILYNLMYNYLPFFSSFRAPVMIHYYMDLAFVILAGFGLKSIVDAANDEVLKRKFKITSYVFLGVAALMFIIAIVGFESSYKDAVLNGPKAMEYKQMGYNLQQVNQHFVEVAKTAYSNTISNLMLNAFLIIIVIVSAYMFTLKKLSLNIFLVITAVIVVFDILNISLKTVHWDTKSQKDDYFKKGPDVEWILNKDADTYQYRVAEFSKGKLTTSNSLAVHRLQQFNGYHGAKMRIYQDAIDVAGGENPFLLGLGNVKYLISDSPMKDTINFKEVYRANSLVYENKAMLPRAFFAGEYKVADGMTILNNIKAGNFDPRMTAFVEQDINKKIDKPDSSAYAKLVKADIHKLEYDVNATGNNLLVFSEIYYPPDWKAYIDGNETEIYKTNYLLRAIIIPAGKHKIEMKFVSEPYEKGRMISIAANTLIVVLLVAGISGNIMRKKKQQVS
ncbi:MAG TPA: YfhO family protein [Ignavibacteria bacterium]